MRILKRVFVRQSGTSDCGLACLAMVLNFSGHAATVSKLREIPVADNGLSLLELKDLAVSFGMQARCVEMDSAFLLSTNAPCILLTQNDDGQAHYEVCFGSHGRKTKVNYLLADPAQQVYILPESALLEKWPSRAALVFPTLQQDLTGFSKSGFRILLSLLRLPLAMYMAIPVLSSAAASFGMALSWFLQTGMHDNAIIQGPIILALIPLLLVLSLIKSAFGFVRQCVLVKINTSLQEYLQLAYLHILFHPSAHRDAHVGPRSIRDASTDIYKIQQGASALLAIVLSDGALALFIIAGISYVSPWAGVANLLLVGWSLWLFCCKLPLMTFDVARVSRRYQAAEQHLIRDIERLPTISQAGLLEEHRQIHLSRIQNNTQLGRVVSLRLSKLLLFGEWFFTVNVMVTLVLGLLQFNHQEISYTTFMLIVIASYLVGNFTLRIENALLTVAEGMDAAIQYSMHRRKRT